MNKVHHTEWNIRGWYVAQTTFIGIHVAALVFYVFGAIAGFDELSVELSQPGSIGDTSVFPARALAALGTFRPAQEKLRVMDVY